MIQLGLTRIRMLADIGAQESDLGADPLDAGDPAFMEREPARLVVRAHHRAELFGRLEPVLRRRFGRGASVHLDGDLLVPLRRAIGNAHRRGNQEDPARWLTAEVIATSRGAVLAVTDEGSGFDVERVVRQFDRKERYFTREGHGIACFAQTSSVVSYADGGRTWLLRYLSDPEPGEPLIHSEAAALGPAGDPAFMKSFLADQLPCFRDQGVGLDTCRVYALSKGHGTVELAYVLRCRSGDQAPETSVLTGRLLPEAAARTDVGMAERLRAAGVGAARGLRVAPPLGAFREPSLSLFRLDPSVTFREDVRKMTGFGPLALVLRLIAAGLAAIHLSSVSPDVVENFSEILDRHRNAKQRVEARLADKQFKGRASACFDRLFELSDDLEPYEPVPIHGALEWDSIVASREGWELYRFDRSRLSHPGVDVGVFLADLLRFHNVRRKGDPGQGEAGRAVFLESYFEGSRPRWARDMDWFVASALLERLDRMVKRDESKWAPDVDPMLAEVERALERSSSAAS